MATFSISSLDAELRNHLQNELLALGDSKLVLGNWYITCVHNGRSLPDFAAILGMATVSLGHTRALYQYLVDFGLEYSHLERGRGARDMRSMNLLDEAPRSWEDFVAATYLAEQAMWTFASGFLQHPDRTLAGLVRKFGEEAYFHFKYAHGWMRIFAETGPQPFLEAVTRRFPTALQWFGPEEAADPVHEAGWRKVPLRVLREAFVGEVRGIADKLGVAVTLGPRADIPSGWTPVTRRRGVVPEPLFEIIRFKDPDAVV